MDAERFQKLLRDPSRTKADLKAMEENARAKGRDDLAVMVVAVISARFGVSATTTKAKAGGKTPTEVRFLRDQRYFDTAKDGYEWMVSQFCGKFPKLFDQGELESLSLPSGSSRVYFAATPQELYPQESAHLADNKTNYAVLPNGLYIDLNLSNSTKHQILKSLASAAGMNESDWSWKVLP